MSQKSSYPLCKRLLLHSPCYRADGQRRFRVHMFQGVFQFWLLLPGVSFDCLGLLSCSEAGFSSPALKPLEKFDMLPFYRLQSYIYSSGLLSKERSCSPCSSLCKTIVLQVAAVGNFWVFIVFCSAGSMFTWFAAVCKPRDSLSVLCNLASFSFRLCSLHEALLPLNLWRISMACTVAHHLGLLLLFLRIIWTSRRLNLLSPHGPALSSGP